MDRIVCSKRNPLDLECLRDFDHARFGVLARALQVLLGHGAVDHAIAAVRQFAQQTRRRPATIDSQLVDVIPVKMANALEEIGCTTASALLKLRDAEILAVPNLGERVIEIREQLRRELAAGVRLEECGGDEELEFDWLADDVPRDVLDFVEGRMIQPEGKQVSVMDALKVISERGMEAAMEIDRKLIALEAEIASLKKMKAMLLPPAPRKPMRLPESAAPVASAMLKALVGKTLKPSEIASEVKSTAIMVGKIAKNDSLFMRYSDGRIGIA